MSPRSPTAPSSLGPTRANIPGLGPGPRPASNPLAAHQAMLSANLARSVASGERYLDALRVRDAQSRASQLRHFAPTAKQDATRLKPDAALAFASHQRYAVALAAKPRATIRPGLTPEERLWLNTVATMPYELALMVRFDPVVRSVGGAVAVVGAVEVAPIAYMTGEDAAIASIETSAEFLEAEGLNLYNNFAAVTIRSFLLKSGVSVAGQVFGNYLVTHDTWQAAGNINFLSAGASGLNVPLGYNSLFSAGFSLTTQKGFKSVLTGDISSYELGRDAIFNYGFGKASAGFKLPGSAGRSWIGLDKLHQTQPLNYSVGFATYQAMLRTGPRIGYGLGLGLGIGLEQGNKVFSGATKKYLGTKLKEKMPDPAKAHEH